MEKLDVSAQVDSETSPILTAYLQAHPNLEAIGTQHGNVTATLPKVLYLQGYFPVMQVVWTKRYLIPGLHIDTGVGTVTPQNVAAIKPLIQQGIRWRASRIAGPGGEARGPRPGRGAGPRAR